ANLLTPYVRKQLAATSQVFDKWLLKDSQRELKAIREHSRNPSRLIAYSSLKIMEAAACLIVGYAIDRSTGHDHPFRFIISALSMLLYYIGSYKIVHLRHFFIHVDEFDTYESEAQQFIQRLAGTIQGPPTETDTG